MLKKVPITGGAALTIAPAGTNNGYGASWGTDNRIVFANVDGIFRVSADGGTPERIVELKTNEFALRPQVLPDGDHLLFTLANGVGADRWDAASIVVQSVSTGEREVILKSGADARYVDTGHLVYALGSDILAVAFDADARQLRGAPVIVERDIMRSGAANTGAAQFVASLRGDVAYVPDSRVSAVLTFIEPNTGLPSASQPFASQPPVGASQPRISPDGSRVAVLENGDVWVYSLSSRTAPRRITSDGGNSAMWTPNGLRIAYWARTESGEGELRWQDADGAGPSEHIVTGSVPIGWSQDSTAFVFEDREKSWVQRRRGKPEPLWDVEWGGSLSPDGRWLAFFNAEGNRRVLYVGSVNDPGKVYQVSREGGHHPLWSRDGAKLYYAANNTGPFTALMAVDVRMSPSVTFGEPIVIVKEILQILSNVRNFDVAPDGRVLAQVPDPQRSTLSGEIIVVLNWAEELKRRVPVN